MSGRVIGDGGTIASAVVAEIGRRVPGAEYRDGVLNIDSDGLAEAVRRIDAERGGDRVIDDDGVVTGGGADTGPRRRELVDGGDPDAPAAIPPQHSNRFHSRDGLPREYAEGGDIREIAEALIEACSELHDLGGLDIRYLWRKKGRKKGSKVVFGTCQKLSGLARYGLGGGEFLVILDAENCELYGLSAWQLEALIYHELNHIQPPDPDDPASQYELVGHDFEGFSSELKRYGLWHRDARRIAPAFEQARIEGL